MVISCQTSVDNNQPITLESLLHEMVSYNAVAQYPAITYKAAQVSSYDRRSVSPDSPNWFANGDGFGYERLDTIDGRVEKVLFDEDSVKHALDVSQKNGLVPGTYIIQKCEEGVDSYTQVYHSRVTFA